MDSAVRLFGCCFAPGKELVEEEPSSCAEEGALDALPLIVHIAELGGSHAVFFQNAASLQRYGKRENLPTPPDVVRKPAPWHGLVRMPPKPHATAVAAEEATSPRCSSDSPEPPGSGSAEARRRMRRRRAANVIRGGGDAVSKKDEGDGAWHDVWTCVVPHAGRPRLMVVEVDATTRVKRMEDITDVALWQLALLQQIYPRHFLIPRPSAATDLVAYHSRTHTSVTVVFADVVGFTPMAHAVDPAAVMAFLSELYTAFDAVMVRHPWATRYEIAGDCFIAVGGLATRDSLGFVDVMQRKDDDDCGDGQDDAERGGGGHDSEAVAMVQLALEIRSAGAAVVMPAPVGMERAKTRLRIGIHRGPAVSGVIGTSAPKFMLFGDVMNTASRMQTTCPPDAVQVSCDALAGPGGVMAPLPPPAPGMEWSLVRGVQVRGRSPMDTWVLSEPLS